MKNVAPVSSSCFLEGLGRASWLPAAARLIAMAGILALAPATVLANPVSEPARMSDEAPGAGPAAVERSPDGLWRAAPNLKASQLGAAIPRLRDYRTFTLDRELLADLLQRVGNMSKGAGTARGKQGWLSLPLPDGSYARFSIIESPLFSPEMQARFPNIRTYRGQGIDDPSSTVMIEHSPFGFRAYIIADDETAVIDPAGSGANYLSYWKHNAERDGFSCSTHEPEASVADILPALALRKARPNGGDIRTYRFAATLTGEYTTYFAGISCPAGSPAGCPTTAAVAALATTMNRVRGIYEREVAVSFSVVATNVYTDPATDPFTNGAKIDNALLDENQADVDAVTGAANYDIGHIFSAQGSGGLAPGRACSATKARGGTSRPNPSGDPYDVDYVAHEVGHQLSASHTWSGTQGSCSASAYTASSAYEPGSGSTIMAYAGICPSAPGGDNLQSNSDAYFHNRSIDQITDFRNNAGTGGSCGALTGTGNTPPSANAGGDFTIPRGTPFVLTASGSDANGDSLTYAWEQYDTGAQVTGPPPSTQATGPLFRSFSPTASPSRTFPVLSSLLGGAASTWEVLPTVDRTLTFRVTARDNRGGGGGTDFDTMIVNVAGAPFSVTQPGAGANLQCGTGSTLNWDVGGGSVAPNVSVDVSTNNGAAFSTLIGSTANDGSEGFTVPRVLTSAGRIRIAAIGNVFFSLSPQFNIVDTLQPSISVPGPRSAECAAPAGTSVSLGLATATDVCDFTPTVTSNAPLLFPLGISSVIWTATDDANNSASASQLVTIVDTQPPVVTAPANVTAECTGPLGTPVSIGLATAADICDANPLVTNNAPSLFPLGTTPVTWFARDASSNQGTATQSVKVQDTTAPKVLVSLARTALWPANNNLVNVGFDAAISDVCDPSPVSEVRILSDERDVEPQGSGNFSPDAADIAFNTLRLRSGRGGNKDGRVYLVVVKATDASGNVGVDCGTVVVPHDQSASSIASVNAQAAEAKAFCLANVGAAPPGYFVIGNGPAIGPKR